MSSTVLCMIVKNEEKLIIDTLKSVIDKVDFAVICDTGSTDSTLEVLQKNNLGNKIKVIAKGDFNRFDESRNEVFEYVYTNLKEFSQVLWLDAGDIFHGDLVDLSSTDSVSTELGAVSCLKTTHTAEGGGSQQTIRLTRNNGKFFYKYPVHEQLYHVDLGTDFKCKYTDKFSIIQKRDIHEEEKTTNRAQWDIKQLEMYLSENTTDIMCRFHLGQVYERIGEVSKAIEAYRHCITLVKGESHTLHVHNELLFQCYLRVACLLTKKDVASNNDVEKIGNWMMSYIISGRIEGLYDYACYLYEKNRLMLAYAMSVVCIMAQCPTNEQFMMGIDTECYLYKRYALHATICKMMNRKEECLENIKLALNCVEDNDESCNKEKIAYCRQLMNID